MKLYSLTLQAIGPFGGAHTIDLAALGQSGIFLLEGPTGAGKSTIIDAIVFALYGDLAGEASSKQRLHSHHAERGVEPFVDLVFEVDAGLFRVRRSPAHQRPKRKGDGTTKQNESVILTRLSSIDAIDAGQPISTSTQEVGHEIPRLVGLRKDQFLQTVVLPQGEFATFLRSTGEERKELLETIFRTEIYERLTRTLVEMRRDANARTESARHAVREATAVLASAADVEIEALQTIDGTVDVQACDDVVAVAKLHATEAATVAAQASADRHDAEQSLTTAEQLTAALQRRVELLDRRAELEAEHDEVHAASLELDAGRRAAVVESAVKGRAAAVVAADRARAAHAEAVAALGLDSPLSEQECADRDEALSQRLTHVSTFMQLEAGLAAREAQVDEIDEAVSDAQAQQLAVQQRIDERPARREALTTARAEGVELAGGLSQAQTARERAEAAVASAQAADLKAVELTDASAVLGEVSARALEAVETHGTLRLRRLQGMAGELAGALEVGHPCAVCGSVEHPQPAELAPDHPDEHEIETADVAARAAEKRVAAARSVVDKLETELAAARQLAGGLAPDDARSVLDDAEEAMRVALQATTLVAEIDRQLTALVAAELADERERGEIRATLVQLTERRSHLAGELASDRARIAEALREESEAGGDEATSLIELSQQLAGQRRLLQRHAVTMRDQQTAVERLDTATIDLGKRLAEHGFVTADEVEDALVPVSRVSELEHLVTTHRRQQTIVEHGLAAAEIVALTGTEEPQLDSARAACEQASAADQVAAAAAATALARSVKVQACRDALGQAVGAAEATASDAAAVIRMADIADGTSPANLKHLTLGTYVLMRRFEDVVVAANARLGPMSDGRYQLRATDEKERTVRSRRTGLALAVLDTHTGVEREPRTLSGGETFYVSLCLALGLADVVTGEAGGIEIGTLFVDEGFGSLDPETLDDVMSELTALAKGGRVIGIVSHVEDLKLRVTDRIEVRRRDDGSSTLTVKV